MLPAMVPSAMPAMAPSAMPATAPTWRKDDTSWYDVVDVPVPVSAVGPSQSDTLVMAT